MADNLVTLFKGDGRPNKFHATKNVADLVKNHLTDRAAAERRFQLNNRFAAIVRQSLEHLHQKFFQAAG